MPGQVALVKLCGLAALPDSCHLSPATCCVSEQGIWGKSLFTGQSWGKGCVLSEYQGDGVGGMEVADSNGGCVTDPGL